MQMNEDFDPMEYCISLIYDFRQRTHVERESSDELEQNVENYMCHLLDQVTKNCNQSEFVPVWNHRWNYRFKALIVSYAVLFFILIFILAAALRRPPPWGSGHPTDSFSALQASLIILTSHQKILINILM